MDYWLQNHTQLFKFDWKMVLFSTLGIDMWFWSFWTYFGSILGQFWPNFGPKWANMTLSSQFLKFSCKICTQRMKLCDKVVLFTSLCCLIKNWLFREISKLWGPKSPRAFRKHTLKIFSWTFLIYRYWKLGLLLLG